MTGLIESAVFAVLIGFYFFSNGSETPLKEAVFAIMLYSVRVSHCLLVCSAFPRLYVKVLGAALWSVTFVICWGNPFSSLQY